VGARSRLTRRRVRHTFHNLSLSCKKHIAARDILPAIRPSIARQTAILAIESHDKNTGKECATRNYGVDLAWITSFLIALTVGAGGVALAQSFHPIEIPPVPFRLHSPVARVLDISPDGSRVAGAVVEHGVNDDCFGQCTRPFIWTLSGGIDIQSFLKPIELFKTEYRAVTLPVEEVVGVTTDAALTNGYGGYWREASPRREPRKSGISWNCNLRRW
jgi:hypothetical protein